MKRYKHYAKPARPDSWLHSQRRATNALVTFCVDHQHQGNYLAQVIACKNALDVADINGAVAAYKNVPLGGNGCFNDWMPSYSEPENKEVAEYALGVFEALVERWSRLMSLSVEAMGA